LNRFSIAHLSDLHLPLPERRPPLGTLLSKRFFSWLSWRRSRRFIHRADVLAAVMEDVAQAKADHLLVSGDLTNLALPEEFEAAQAWLAAQGPPDTVSAVPGNHDALVRQPWAGGLARLAPWMGGAEAPEAFPFVKRIEGAALVGVSTAVPTAPFMATGRVGEAQLARLEAILEALGREGAFRIVAIHHPITEGAVSERKALKDRAALRAVLARAGAELVLHGHSHHAAIESVPGPAGPIPVVAAPSASADAAVKGPPGGWSRVEVAASNAGWTVKVELRTLPGAGGTIGTSERFEAEVPRPKASG